MSAFAQAGIAYVVAGFVVSFIVGLTGTGGGSLMTPLLVLLFGVHPATAVGTDLLYAAITKACGTAVHQIGATIEWRLVRLLAAGSLPAALLTLLVLHRLHVNNREYLSELIGRILGAALLLTTLSLFLRRWVIALAHRLSMHRRPKTEAAATVGLGVLVGILVSASSVGAGAIGVTVLVLLYPHLPLKRIVGTDIAYSVPLTLAAGAGHIAIGTVNFRLLLYLLLGSVPGIALGSWLAPRAPERALRIILAVMLALVGARLVLR